MTAAARRAEQLVGSPRLRPGEGFAVRRGLARWAAAVAVERRSDPAGLKLRSGPQLVSRTLGVAGNRLHVRTGGPSHATATAVVLVHGVIVSSRYLMPLGVELAGERRVLIPDLPGYGLSDPVTPSPRLAGLADALVACANAAGVHRMALVGNSFGAQVAVEATVRHPASVERIALLGPTVDPAARNLLTQYVRWQRNAPDEHLSVLALMARDLLDVGPLRAARLLRVMLEDAIEDKLPHVRCPALVLRGGRDRVVPVEWARRAADHLPRGELVTLPGYAHMAHYSGACAVAAVLHRFLGTGSAA